MSEEGAPRVLEFESIDEATAVLRPYRIVDRLKAMEDFGFDVEIYPMQALADFIGASRERVRRSLAALHPTEAAT